MSKKELLEEIKDDLGDGLWREWGMLSALEQLLKEYPDIALDVIKEGVVIALQWKKEREER